MSINLGVHNNNRSTQLNLDKYHVECWPEFIEREGIDLTCPTCKGTGYALTKCLLCAGTGYRDNDDECVLCDGTGIISNKSEVCDDCGGDGGAEPMWNTIWDTGYHSIAASKVCERFPGPSVFAFDWQNHVWFGLTGCGMDFTPYLALAWINAWPDCNWLPENFCVDGCNLTGGYIKSCVGAKDAMRIYRVMKHTYIGQVQSDRARLKTIREVIKNARLEAKK